MSKSNLADLAGRIKKQYGDISMSAESLPATEGRFIPVTLGLDIALKGGLLEGTVVNISGVSMAGKTTLILEMIKNAQKMGKPALFCDAENRLKTALLKCIDGIDLSLLTVVKTTKEKFVVAEDYLNIILSWLKEIPGCIVILDSVAALLGDEGYNTPLGEKKKMLSTPSLMYDFLRAASSICAANLSTLVLVTHIQANPTAYGGPTEVGGNAMKYFGSTRLQCLSSQEFPKDSSPKEGRVSEFKVLKSAVGPPSTATVYIRYGQGCDHYLDLIENATQLGIIEQTGAWYRINLPGLDENKIQGKNGVEEVLRADRKVFDKVDKAIRKIAFGGVEKT